jgi:hypothetical protein
MKIEDIPPLGGGLIPPGGYIITMEFTIILNVIGH